HSQKSVAESSHCVISVNLAEKSAGFPKEIKRAGSSTGQRKNPATWAGFESSSIVGLFRTSR
ncbi:MAG: hypothetical protein ABIL01_30260, partial [Pseudomonadota bacterium]